MHKIKLTFTERLQLGQLMPGEDTFSNLVVREDVKEKIKLSQEDFENNNFKPSTDGRAQWTDTGETIEIELSNPEKEYLKSKLTEASDKKKLNEKLIQVYKSIV